MSKIFQDMSTEGNEESEDRVGGGFQPLSSDVYNGKITLAYAGESRNGARCVTLHIDIDGQEHRETIYISNRNKETFFKDKDGNQVTLPGFNMMDEICLFATEKHLNQQDAETKTIKLYNYDERKELPTEVPVLVDLIGAEMQFAIKRVIEDKRKQGQDGNYHPTGETFVKNEIKKAFHPETGRTIKEYTSGNKNPEFRDEWVKVHTGKDQDKSSGAAAGGGQSGSGKPNANEPTEPKQKLFG